MSKFHSIHIPLFSGDVCHEYKSELKKLQHEYDQLKHKINMRVTEKNEDSKTTVS